MIAFMFIVGWLFLGWVGWRIVLWWWTFDLDMTRSTRNWLRVAIIFGPIFTIVGGLCALERVQLNRKDPDEILYPRRDR